MEHDQTRRVEPDAWRGSDTAGGRPRAGGAPGRPAWIDQTADLHGFARRYRADLATRVRLARKRVAICLGITVCWWIGLAYAAAWTYLVAGWPGIALAALGGLGGGLTLSWVTWLEVEQWRGLKARRDAVRVTRYDNVT